MQRNFSNVDLYRIIESLQAIPFHINSIKKAGLLGPGTDPDDPKSLKQDLKILGDINSLLIALMPQYEQQLEFDVLPAVVKGRLVLGKPKSKNMVVKLTKSQWKVFDTWTLKYTLPGGLVEHGLA